MMLLEKLRPRSVADSALGLEGGPSENQGKAAAQPPMGGSPYVRAAVRRPTHFRNNGIGIIFGAILPCRFRACVNARGVGFEVMATSCASS